MARYESCKSQCFCLFFARAFIVSLCYVSLAALICVLTSYGVICRNGNNTIPIRPRRSRTTSRRTTPIMCIHDVLPRSVPLLTWRRALPRSSRDRMLYGTKVAIFLYLSLSLAHLFMMSGHQANMFFFLRLFDEWIVWRRLCIQHRTGSQQTKASDELVLDL